MTLLDWVLVVVWAGITLGGFFKGAVRIVFGLGGAALGVWLAVVVGPALAVELSGSLDTEWLAIALAYLVPVMVVSLLCLLAGWGMEKTLEQLKLGCLNRLLGAALAGSAAAVVLAVLLVSAVRISPELREVEERSSLLAKVQAVMGVVVSAPKDEGPQADSAPIEDVDKEPEEEDSSSR